MVFKLYSKALVCGVAVVFLSFPAFAQKKSKNRTASTSKKVITLNAPIPDEPYNRGIEYHYEKNGEMIKIFPTYPGICSNMFNLTISQKTHPETFSKIKASNPENHIIPYPSLDNSIVHFEAGKLENGSGNNCLKIIYIDTLDHMHDARMFFIEQVFEKDDEKRISKALANLIAHCYSIITKEFETTQTDRN